MTEALHVNFTIECSIKAGIRSDHSIMGMTITSSERKRGPGVWRYNNELLADEEHVDTVRAELREAKYCRGRYSGDIKIGVKVEMLLSEIRVHSIFRSKNIAQMLRKEENDLIEQITALEKDLSGLSSQELNMYDELKQQLEEVKTRHGKAAIIASGARWIESGEKATKYFLNRGRQMSAQKTLTRIRHNGQIITDDKRILQHCVEHYRSLYRANDVNGSKMKAFLDNAQIPKLSPTEQRRGTDYL